MSEPEEGDPESPAEARVSDLVRDLRHAPAPAGGDLPARVSRTARWQASVRRALLNASRAAAGLADGVGTLVRGKGRS
jgi:hypothetical protein